jgi:MFS family permease
MKLGGMSSNLIWMPIGNRIGTRVLIHAGILSALVAIALSMLAQHVLLFSLAFFVTGLAFSALMLGYNGYILEIGPAETRVLLVAIKDTMLLPLYFMPLVGGLIVDTKGYDWLLGSGMVLYFLALLLAWTLCEPRHGDNACGPIVTID